MALRFPFLLLACAALVPHHAAGQIDAERFRQDLAALAQPEGRLIGTAGYEKAAQYLQTQISSLPNVEPRSHEFFVMMPVTETATLEVSAARSERVYPLWPAHVRVCSTPPEGITGALVYVGRCRPEELRPASLRGQIAVIEASAQERWVEAPYVGAKAVLILGGEDLTWPDLSSHDLRVPVNLPRFYIPAGKLADELRAGRIARGTLRATVTWQKKRARNFYALVRPQNKIPPRWNDSMPPAALMYSAAYDSSSIVPDLAPGASQAVQVAAGLALLRDLSAHPWDRPIVVFFGGADSVQFLGTRNMFLALAEAPEVWRKEIVRLERQIASADHDLAKARAAASSPQRLSLAADRDLIARISVIIETDLAAEQDRLFRLRARRVDAPDEEAQSELKSLEDRQLLLNRLKFAFGQEPASLAEADLASEARNYLSRTIARLGGDDASDGLVQQHRQRKAELEARISLYRWLADAEGRVNDPQAGRTDARLIELLVGLDLSDRGSRCGPMSYGYFQRNSAMPLLQEYRDWFSRVQREAAGAGDGPAKKWWPSIAQTISLEPLNQARLPSTYLAGPLPVPSELAQAWGTPGLSMITLDDLRLRRDTPCDTLEHIDVDAILAQLRGVRELFFHAWNDARFRGPGDLKRPQVSVSGQVVSPSAGKPVPDLPRPGFLATYYYIANKDKKIPQLGALPWTLGIRRGEVRDCDAEGNYRFEGLPKLRNERLEGTEKQQADMQLLAVHVYRVDPASGAITATTDLGTQAGEIKWAVDIKEPLLPLRSLVFNCEEFTLTRLYDPRFLQTLAEVLPLDARRDAEPQRYNLLAANQMLAGFAEPEMPWHLLIRYGRVGNRLLLVNMKEGRSPSPLGYTPRQIRELGPLALETARDFYRLDEQRLSEYRRAGVSAKLIDTLHAEAAGQIEGAERAVRADDGVALVRNATGAWANEARVYNAAQAMARDVIRAAIFLLLLCVPFSFCMERLLIGTPSVYKQIAGMMAIFLVMLLALWSFHPAFKISASPLIIVLAFAIILMSCVVIAVVYGKFDTELKRIRAGMSAPVAGFASAGVLMAAVLLGIANMRKRRFRTALTSITVALITFAVLCFTSTTHYVGTATEPTGVASAHPGILLRQRGFRSMPGLLADQLRAVLAHPALKISPPTVVERWWAVSTLDPNEQYNLVARGKGAADTSAPKVVTVPAVLGLSPGESGLSRIADVIGPAQFARLERGEEAIVYLSQTVADQLGVREGDSIRIGGMDVVVAGVFDAKAFDQKVVTLSGESLAPLKYVAGQLDAGGRKLDDTASESLSLDTGAADIGSYEHLSADDFVIVPSALCRKLYKSSLRSVAFRLADEQQVKRVADELARRFSLAMFAGYDDGVRMVASSQLASVSGGAQAAVPLIIGGLIIFNTMMGSIAERRREIHVYTSLGLAPLHVGALFLAEAMVYGLIGAVFGYVIGQGAGTLLSKLGILGPVTLNYSGSSAALTMGLILLIVLLSALLPARVAAKVAAPSIERSWKVPQPKDDQILAVLPFTINKTAADGALAYLAEYFEVHRNGNIGKFAAGRIEAVASASSAAEERGLRTTVWLTPFDLGVRQEIALVIHPGQAPDIFEVKVLLKRLSGDERSWHRMNRPFLTEVRRQFLRWRTLSPARMLEYVERSRALFADRVAL